MRTLPQLRCPHTTSFRKTLAALLIPLLAAGSFSGCGNLSSRASAGASTTASATGTVASSAASSSASNASTSASDASPSASGPSATPTDASPAASTSSNGTDALADKYGLTSASPTPSVVIPDIGATSAEMPDNEDLRFVRDMTLGWNLGNSFDAIDGSPASELDYESMWNGAKTTKELLAAIRAKGFRTVRIPVSWHNHVDGDDYTIRKPWLDRVQEVVDWALAEDLYVILNIHHDNSPKFLYPDTAHFDVSSRYVARIWAQLSERFQDYGDHLVFESMNEPRLTESAQYQWWISMASEECRDAVDCINRLNQLFVDTVRKSGGQNETRRLMVPGYCASPQFAAIDEFVLPTDPVKSNGNRILVSAHAYTPYNFALQGPNETGSIDTFKIKNPYSTKDIDTALEGLYRKFVSKGIPVVIGEFGSRAKGENLQARVDHAAYFVMAARARGMTCVWWDNNAFDGTGENFGLIDRASLAWKQEPIADAMVRYAGKAATP